MTMTRDDVRGGGLPPFVVRGFVPGLTVAAVVACVLGLWLDRGDPLASPIRVVLLIGLVSLANLFSLRMSVRATPFRFGFVDSVIVLGFVVVPTWWVPVCVGLGVLCASAVRCLQERRPVVEAIRAASSLALCAAAAAGVVRVAGLPAGPLDVQGGLVLAAAGLVYIVGTAVMLALVLKIRDGGSAWHVFWTALRGTPVMIVGNICLGLVAAGLWSAQSTWLWAMPPLLFLSWQVYQQRSRDDAERSTWQAFATASRSLHRLDEAEVADQGIRSLLALFPAESVTLTVFGSGTAYTGRAGSTTVQALPAVPSENADPGILRRPLEVAGVAVGVLAIQPRRPDEWARSDTHRLAAFGDGLAAALHDAATHEALRLLRDRSSFESRHDALTRLLTRDAMLSQGESLLQAGPPHHVVALLLFDVDRFKEVNDTLGHTAGDELLQLTAARLAAQARPGEVVARLGGDEFGMIIIDVPGETETARLAAITERAAHVAAALAAPVDIAGVTLSAEVTAGIAVGAASGHDLTELLRRADVALYQAKASSLPSVVYDAEQDRGTTDRLALVAELRTALDDPDQLLVVLQPSVDLRTGAPTGVEALVRWEHPRRGLLIPADFVRAVEASDLLPAFTLRVLDMALTAAATWRDADLDLPVSVNMSPRGLLDARLPDQIHDMLRKHQVPPHRLVLEITETVVLSPQPVIDDVLGRLRALGVRLAVDDFGTGYSSLTFLTRIAVDELKVDRTFVASMTESKQSAAIVEAVVDLGSRMGMQVVAEGVETVEQRTELLRLGCAAGQGFLFSRPTPVVEIVDLLRRLRDQARPPGRLRAVRRPV